jgi:NAD(P)-dependent dehydrogenase (short-subunit alcohol dehydrogenase family)
MTSRQFLRGKIAVVTGGTGVLGSRIAVALASEGARVGVLGRDLKRANGVVREIEASGGEAVALIADVLKREDLLKSLETLRQLWGEVDVLVNAAGGHVKDAITSESLSFFEIPTEALRSVVDLNLIGTILPTQIFGASMALSADSSGSASIINFSSMSADRALSRVVGYGAAKAGVENFTRWAASELASLKRPIRVNAIAPGFFVAETNKSLLVDESGPTERGRQILLHTPMGRFGAPNELVGIALWLASDDSAFVTGAVVPVDGGFSASSGI